MPYTEITASHKPNRSHTRIEGNPEGGQSGCRVQKVLAVKHCELVYLCMIYVFPYVGREQP